MRKLLKGQGHSPRVMITDKLRSYGAAKRDITTGVEHRSHKGLNNRVEDSHQPTRADHEGLHKRVNAVLWNEVTDHMIVPMGILVVFVLGASLLSITTALRPVRRAAKEAAAIDAADPQSRLDTVGMSLELAQLAGAINEAIARVRHLMEAPKLLTSALAHGVRTPWRSSSWNLSV